LSVDLESTAIVPLDRAFNLFAIQQNNNHQGVSVNLLLVIKDLRVGFAGRGNSFLNLDGNVLLDGALALLTTVVRSAGTSIRTLSGLRNLSGFAFDFRECGSDEFTIHLIITSKNLRTGVTPVTNLYA